MAVLLMIISRDLHNHFEALGSTFWVDNLFSLGFPTTNVGVVGSTAPRCISRIRSWHVCALLAGGAWFQEGSCFQHSQGVQAFMHLPDSMRSPAEELTAHWSSACLNSACRQGIPRQRGWRGCEAGSQGSWARVCLRFLKSAFASPSFERRLNAPAEG